MSGTASNLVRRLIALRLGALGLIAAVMLALAPAANGQPVSKEYQLKAVFIYNFAQFVDWPTNASADTSVPFRIGVLGDSPFGSVLDETVKGETVRGRKLVVVHAARIDALKDCQIIFICKSERNRIGDILSSLDHQPILTVSETDNFAQHGGMISFFLDVNKVKFEINPAAAKESGLAVSSQLLSVGKIVGGDLPSRKR